MLCSALEAGPKFTLQTLWCQHLQSGCGADKPRDGHAMQHGPLEHQKPITVT